MEKVFSNHANWSYPSPVYHDGKYQSGGMVWMGDQPATEADKQALRVYYTGEGEPAFDELSLVGLFDPEWSCFRHTVKPTRHPQGGLRSFAYEHQKVGRGVKFTDHAIFHFNEEGRHVHDIPPNHGAYHTGVNGDAYAGPEPDSEAERILGDGLYFWNVKRNWYEVHDKSANQDREE